MSADLGIRPAEEALLLGRLVVVDDHHDVRTGVRRLTRVTPPHEEGPTDEARAEQRDQRERPGRATASGLHLHGLTLLPPKARLKRGPGLKRQQPRSFRFRLTVRPSSELATASRLSPEGGVVKVRSERGASRPRPIFLPRR